MVKKIRVLIAKPGLDGHDRGAKVVETAIQEDVDVIALSILSGAHMTIFTKVIKLMKENDITDKLLTGGGIIPEVDIVKLKEMGVGNLFGPGSSTQDSIKYIQDWISNKK